MMQNEDNTHKLRVKLVKVRDLLNAIRLDAPLPPGDCLACLASIKEIVGNLNNDVSALACLMSHEYLCRKHDMASYDPLAKAQGAAGLDINEQTRDGQRVIGEIKTTGAYGLERLQANQFKNVKEDLEKLISTNADYKYFFVTDAKVFTILKRSSYARYIRGLTIVLLPAGEEYSNA